MGSNMKPTIFEDRVAHALRKWHRTAKKQAKQSRHSTSLADTPMQSMSPVHLLRHHQEEGDQTSPSRISNFDNEDWEMEDSFSPSQRTPATNYGIQVEHEIDIHPPASREFSFDKPESI